MNWKKYFQLDTHKNLDYIIVGILGISFISFIMKKPLLFVIVGIFVVYFIFSELYQRSVGENLDVENKRTIVRAYPGEDIALELLISNRSILPYINGMLEVSINDVVSTTVHEHAETGERSHIKIPTSIMGKRKTRIHVQLHTEKRGVARIYQLKYRFPHLINFDFVELTYSPYLHQEIVVFPEMKEVHGIQQLRHDLPGEQRVRFSPYEDIQSMIGTRDYVSTDPFHRINWNASVKTGELQTNEFERVIDRSFFILVNLTVTDLRLDVMEDFLSYTAFLLQDIHQQGLPYEMVVNARKLGNTPFIYQKQGEGNAHYIQSLDILARIDRHGITSRMTQVLMTVRDQLARAHTIVYIGQLSENEYGILQNIVGSHKSILHIDENGDLKKLTKEVITRAT